MTEVDGDLKLLYVNPLEQFGINPLFGVEMPLLGYLSISLSNLGLFLILGISLIVSLLLLSNHQRIVANKASLPSESCYATVLSMVNAGLGGKGGIFLPFIFTLLILILGGNLIGMIPYSFCVTAQFALCLSLSIALLMGVTLIGIEQHGIKFLSLFVPSGTPLSLVPLLVVIELISYVARAFSLGIRLAANMLGGHVLLKILSTFTWDMVKGGPLLILVSLLPLAFLTAFTGLELAVSFIQSYVFTVLTISYINEALHLH